MASAKTATVVAPVKMNLRVDVGSPLIIVPVTSTSKDRMLTLDLGSLKLYNKINPVGKDLVDEMTIQVSNVCFCEVKSN